jgi:hypothetical protein
MGQAHSFEVGRELPSSPAIADQLTTWPASAAEVRARLEQGRAAYGSATFERPLPEIADELGAELLDQAAYAFIGWVRLQRLRERLARLEQAS